MDGCHEVIASLRDEINAVRIELAVLNAELKPLKAFVWTMAGITMLSVLAAVLKLVIAP